MMRSESVILCSCHEEWSIWFKKEREAIKALFVEERLLGVEHFGSTAISGLCAKPIVDILVGLNSFCLSDSEMDGLKELGYSFVEKSSYCERFYFQKRGECSFNVSIVLHVGTVWDGCLAVRDFLRISQQKCDEYSAIKHAAIAAGAINIAAYSDYKQSFVRELQREAILWRKNNDCSRFTKRI